MYIECEKCKYNYDSECVFYDMGSGNKTDMPCYRDWITPQENALDKIIEEIMDTLYVDSLIFGELIDFRNGKISADDVIEEFNRVTRAEVLRIIDKYKAESEDEEYEQT